MTGDLISEPSALDTFFTVLGVLVTGLAAGFTVVGVFVYNPPKEEEEEEELYEDKYQEEFEKLEEKELKEDFVKSLVNKHLTEETPDAPADLTPAAGPDGKNGSRRNPRCESERIVFRF